MKACPNCRVIWGDDYAGQCTACGAPMGGVTANSTSASSGDKLARMYSQQRRKADAEAGLESAFRGRGGGGVVDVPVNENVLAVALEVLGEPKSGAISDEA